ncbi:MAG: DUF4386 domain-containing protein, partial [Bryobacteraceae bacterium]
MDSIKRNARVAGFLYLLLVLAGPVRLILIPNTLFVHDNPAATADKIAAHQMLFRLGILSDLAVGVVGLFLVLALYRLFKEVDQKYAVLMVILGGAMVTPIYFLNEVNN